MHWRWVLCSCRHLKVLTQLPRPQLIKLFTRWIWNTHENRYKKKIRIHKYKNVVTSSACRSAESQLLIAASDLSAWPPTTCSPQTCCLILNHAPVHQSSIRPTDLWLTQSYNSINYSCWKLLSRLTSPVHNYPLVIIGRTFTRNRWGPDVWWDWKHFLYIGMGNLTLVKMDRSSLKCWISFPVFLWIMKFRSQLIRWIIQLNFCPVVFTSRSTSVSSYEPEFSFSYFFYCFWIRETTCYALNKKAILPLITFPSLW